MVKVTFDRKTKQITNVEQFTSDRDLTEEQEADAIAQFLANHLIEKGEIQAS